jgi:hypothetical protein
LRSFVGSGLSPALGVCTFWPHTEILVDNSPRPLAGGGTAQRWVRDLLILLEEKNLSARVVFNEVAA